MMAKEQKTDCLDETNMDVLFENSSIFDMFIYKSNIKVNSQVLSDFFFLVRDETFAVTLLT